MAGFASHEDVAIDAQAAFEQFVATDGERLDRLLVAQFGVDVGSDLCADAFEYAWRHWEQVSSMANPVGYLYRVARSSLRPFARWRSRVVLPAEIPDAGRRDDGVDIFQCL